MSKIFMIRKLQENDIDIVMKIWLDTNIKTHNYIDSSYWIKNYNYVKDAILNSEVYVYVDNSTLCGFIGLSNNTIEGIFVKSDMQSKGIGKMLLDYVKNLKDNLFLNVYQKNTYALKFYQREGFSIKSQQVDVSTNEIEYIMLWKC